MSERIALVTGAKGFLGRHVSKALATEGYSVHGFGHGAWSRTEWLSYGLSDWHDCEVTLSALLRFEQTPELLVHCAGGASVSASMADPLEDFSRTVDTTAAALDYLRLRAPAARFILPSSGGVYGSDEREVVSEETPPNPQSAYAAHKLIAETLCESYGRSFSVKSAVVRLFSVYGPGLRKQLLWDVCRKLQQGDGSLSGTGRETRDWLHVEDAAQLILHAADRATASCVRVNGGTGVGVSVSEIAAVLAEALAFPGRLTFSSVGRPGDPFRFVADNSRARGWGWAPRVSWRNGVRDYAAWFSRGAQ
jgi:UDP-glucose 4-epimerase